jgi:hypothetical protein
MIDAGTVSEILKLYQKHGWTLRRVLLSEALRKSFSTATVGLFAGAAVQTAPVDAMWFSRQSKPGLTAWEIRHLSEIPFALVEVIDDSLDPELKDEVFRNTEARMLDLAGKKARVD